MTLAAVPPTRGSHALAADEDARTDLEGTPPQERRSSLGKITTRPSVAEDSAFMLELYASTSKEVLDNLGWSIGGNRTFVIMQAQTEEWNRARSYPGMDRLTICVDEMPVGRLLVCLRNNILHLVDLSLLPRFRGLGIGTQLMGEIIDEARNARVPVKVRVLKKSGSVRFVERLGFTTPTDLGQYVELTWMPPLTALGPDAREEGFVGHGTRANRPAMEETLEAIAEDVDLLSAPDFAAFAAIEPIEPVEPTRVAPGAPAAGTVTVAPDVELPEPEAVLPTDDAMVEAPAPELPAVAETGLVVDTQTLLGTEVTDVEDRVDAAGTETTDDAAVTDHADDADDVEDPIRDVNEAVLAYVAEADTEYLAEPVWLAPEVEVEDEPEVEDVEEVEDEPEVEEDPEVAARNAEYLEAVTATDAFTSSFTSTFSAEVSEDDDTDDDEHLPPGADRYDPFA